MQPCTHRHETFFACSSSAPVRVEREGGAAAWLARTLVVPILQGPRLPLLQVLWPYQSFFEPLVAGDQKTSLASLSGALPIQALKGLPCLGAFSVVWCVRHIEEAPLAGVLLFRWVGQALKGAPWVGSYNVVQCVRHLMGQPLYCSAANAGVWWETGYGDGSTPYG